MKFLKEHSYDAIRLFIMQIGITIFSFFIYTAASAILDDEGQVSSTAQIIISLLSAIFYFALLYVTAWEWGAKDKIRIDGGRMEPHKTKALKISLLANSVNLLLAFLAVISFIIHLLATVDGLAVFGTACMIIIRFTSMMFHGFAYAVFAFLGTKTFEFSLVYSLFFLGMFLLAILITHLGYFAGTKDFKFIRSSKKKNYE